MILSKRSTGTFLLLGFFILVVLVTIVMLSSIPISDGDIWFHLAYGRYFLEKHTLIPDHSVFSWTPAENSTVYCAWLSEVIFYLFFKAGGLTAHYVLRYLIIGVFLVLVLSLADLRKGSQYFSLMLLALVTGFLMSYAGLRVKLELFSFLFMTLLVSIWFAFKARPDRIWPLLYLLPFIMVLWVNSHGGFVFGMVFLVLILVGELLNRFLSPAEKIHPIFMKHLFIAVLLSMTAPLISPYGWEYPAQLIDKLILNPEAFAAHMKTIAEYQSIFHPKASHMHFIDYLIISSVLLIFILTIQVRRKGIDWAVILVNASFMLLYMKYLRATYFWAVILVFTVIYLIREVSDENQEFPGGKTLSIIINASILTLLLFLSLRAQYQAFSTPTIGFNPSYVSPKEEAEFIRTQYPLRRIGNDYYCGSFLLWSLWPDSKVFIDARYFPYSKWYSEYGKFVGSRDKATFDRFMQKYGCNVWCIAYDSPLMQLFITSPDWRLVCYGASAGVFVSRSILTPQHRHIVLDSIVDAGFYQKYSIVKFAATAGDFDVAKSIAEAMNPVPLCVHQAQMAMNARFNVGNNFLAREQYHEAVELYEGALSIVQANPFINHSMTKNDDGTTALVHQNLGYVLMKTDRPGEALAEFGQALKLNPDLKDAQNYLEVIKGRMKKIDENINRLKEALGKNPDNPRILHSLALHYLMRGEFDNALDAYMLVKNKDPENPEILYNIACIYARESKLDQALLWLSRAMDKGFDNLELLKTDPDLNHIRQTDSFKVLVKEEEASGSM